MRILKEETFRISAKGYDGIPRYYISWFSGDSFYIEESNTSNDMIIDKLNSEILFNQLKKFLGR